MPNTILNAWSVAILIAVLTGTTQPTSADEKQAVKVPQAWTGVLDVGAAKLRLRIDITQDKSGKLKCIMTSVDQGNARIPMDTCTITNGKLQFQSKRLTIVYQGAYKNNNTQVEGKFTQAGKSYNLNFKSAKPPEPTTHVATWQGTMKAGGRSFEFQFRVLETKAKKRSVELDSFSENIGGLLVDSTFDDQGVTFKITVTKAEYRGKYNQDKTQLDGHWYQSGGKFPLVLKKVPLASTRSVKPPKRPQTPQEPFSYKAEDVQFENSAAEVKLAGTLTTPHGKGPFSAVVLITGSGPQDRDETLMEHKPFWVLAHHLSTSGIAVLRYDERGVGQSTGKFSEANSEDFARDAEAAIDYLKQHPQIDPHKIGLLGHSEGGYIAPMIAARRADLAFIVLLAGTGVPGDQIILNQSEKIGRAAGESDEDLELNRRIQQTLFQAIRSANGKDVQQTATKAYDAFVKSLPENQQTQTAVQQGKQAISGMTSRWFLFFLTYDPRPALRRVACPTLVLNGAKDLQVDPDLNLPEIRKALSSSGNARFQIHKLPDLNHLFQTATTGAPSEYRQIEETIAPVALDLVSHWIRETVN